MKLHFYTFLRSFAPRRLAMLTLTLFSAAAVIVLLSYRDGPAFNGEHVTGAPFDNGEFCTKCHRGGNFGASILARLFRSDSTVVNAYTPGQNYYFVIIFKNTTGNPPHGFQTTSARSIDGVNVNGWRTPPAGTANRLLLGHNYMEHTAPLTIDTLILPWRAPAAGTGSVTFYTAANFVNGNNRPTGDQAVRSTFTVAEGTASLQDEYTGVDKFAQRLPQQKEASYSLVAYKHMGNINLRFNNTRERQTALVQLADLQGSLIYSGRMPLNEGNNIIPVPYRNRKGLLVATVITQDGIRTSQKIIVE